MMWRARTFALLVVPRRVTGIPLGGGSFFLITSNTSGGLFTVFFPLGAREIDLRPGFAKRFQDQHPVFDRDDAPRALRHGISHIWESVDLIFEARAGALDILDHRPLVGRF